MHSKKINCFDSEIENDNDYHKVVVNTENKKRRNSKQKKNKNSENRNILIVVSQICLRLGSKAMHNRKVDKKRGVEANDRQRRIFE